MRNDALMMKTWRCQNFNQLFSVSLKILMTRDIIHDISNAIKNENTTLWCLREIIGTHMYLRKTSLVLTKTIQSFHHSKSKPCTLNSQKFQVIKDLINNATIPATTIHCNFSTIDSLVWITATSCFIWLISFNCIVFSSDTDFAAFVAKSSDTFAWIKAS